MKKIVLCTLSFFCLSSFVCAVELTDLKEPKPLRGRLSNTDKPESINYEKTQNIKKAQLTPIENKNNDNKKTDAEKNPDTNYADLSLKKLAHDVGDELDTDNAKTTYDLSILWNAAMNKSETMKYTIYKLSHPDEDKPSETTLKKIIKPIANISTIAGASLSGDPFLATGALVGGNLMHALIKDDKDVNYNFSKVSDADMVLLIRKIDELQKKLLDLYSDYKTKEHILELTQENFKKREEIYKKSRNKSKEEVVIADMYYRNSKVAMQRAKDDFLTSRAVLENLVGKDAVKKIEEDK